MAADLASFGEGALLTRSFMANPASTHPVVLYILRCTVTPSASRPPSRPRQQPAARWCACSLKPSTPAPPPRAALMLSMQDAGMTPPALSNPPSHRNSSSYASDANRGAHAASPAPRPQPDLHHPHHPFLPSSHPLAATLGLGQGLGLGPASGLPQGAPLALLGLGPGGGGGWAGGGLAAAAAALLRGVEYGGYGDMAGVVGGLGGLGGGAGVASEDGGGGGALSYEALLQLEDVKVTTPQVGGRGR